MNPDNLVIVAIVVFLLMFIGIVLTVLEIHYGAPKEQIEDQDKIQESPHGHVEK